MAMEVAWQEEKRVEGAEGTKGARLFHVGAR